MQLGRAAADAAPPFVYMTGQKDISVSKQEVRILRDYLMEKHGMIFGDNGGSSHFHNQFFQMMRQVLPSVEPVRVALDDPIHMRPYRIPFLPYVAPHGGRDAWGWKVDGRWVCYYHPGDIGDAWSDEHCRREAGDRRILLSAWHERHFLCLRGVQQMERSPQATQMTRMDRTSNIERPTSNIEGFEGRSMQSEEMAWTGRPSNVQHPTSNVEPFHVLRSGAAARSREAATVSSQGRQPSQRDAPLPARLAGSQGWPASKEGPWIRPLPACPAGEAGCRTEANEPLSPATSFTCRPSRQGYDEINCARQPASRQPGSPAGRAGRGLTCDTPPLDVGRWTLDVGRSASLALLVLAVLIGLCTAANAQRLDEMSLERWKKLREAERYQLNIAEKYYRDGDYKVAAAEYEKFLRLYEKSEGAPYAQLKWSLAMVQRRQQNTAIKDGFQSVLDYWPDAPEATAAAYYIGHTYKGLAEIKAAKKAYVHVLTKFPMHDVATLARVDLADLARIEGDDKAKVQLWRELTFDAKRTDQTAGHCHEASRQLAVHYFTTGAFAEGKDALATTYQGDQLAPHVMSYVSNPISNLTGAAETKALGEKLADQVIGFLREQMPADLKDEAAKARAKQLSFFIADAYSVSRRPADVPKVYDQMVKSFGVADDILGRLALWQRSQNLRDEAKATYRRFAARPAGLAEIAAMFREEKGWDQAIATYREAASLDAKNVATWEGNIAGTYRQAGKMAEAIAVYQGLMKTDSQRAGSWQWEIAGTFRQFGKLKEAIAAYRLCDNPPQNYWEMAACHRALKEYNEAVLLYLQIVGGHQDWAPQAQLQVGYTYEEAAKKELAIKAFQAVCSRYPKSGQASEAHAHLENKYKINTGGGATADGDGK